MTTPQITQTISDFAGDLPDKDTMTPDEFDVAAEAWVAHWATLITQINAWAQQANAIGVSANDLITALASANFAGQWSSLTGALSVPAAVYHDSQYWMLLRDLENVTTSEPGPENTDWALITMGGEVVVVTESGHTATDSEMRRGVTYTDVGAIAEAGVILPPPQPGYAASFYIATAQGFGCVVPGGIRFRYGSNVTDGLDYDWLYSEAIGTFWTIRAFDDTEYVVTALQGVVESGAEDDSPPN
jgi:hypothetical protein